MPTTYNYSDYNIKYDMGLYINSVQIPDPSEMEWGLQDISVHDAGRDESGIMHPMKIVSKRTVKLGWNMIDPVNAASILGAVSGNAQTFTCILPDPLTAELRTATYYVGDRTVPYQQWFNRLDGHIYSKVSFTLIEV